MLLGSLPWSLIVVRKVYGFNKPVAVFSLWRPLLWKPNKSLGRRRESFLGTIFTVDTLDHLKMVIPSGRCVASGIALCRIRINCLEIVAFPCIPPISQESHCHRNPCQLTSNPFLSIFIPFLDRFWLSRARRHARDVHAQTTMPTLEPKSKGIVAWAAIHLQQRGDTVQCTSFQSYRKPGDKSRWSIAGCW